MSSVGYWVMLLAFYSTLSSLTPKPEYSKLFKDCLRNKARVAVGVCTSGTVQLSAFDIWFISEKVGDSETPAKKLRTTTTILLFHLPLQPVLSYSSMLSVCMFETNQQRKSMPFPCRKPPLNMHFCLKGGDKRMNHIWQMSVTSLNASLEDTGVVMWCGPCESQNRIKQRRTETERSNLAKLGCHRALECRAFTLQNAPGDI